MPLSVVKCSEKRDDEQILERNDCQVGVKIKSVQKDPAGPDGLSLATSGSDKLLRLSKT